METSTPFDLNQAIQQWRDGLAQSPAIRGENLAELEVHLRDSVSALEARGLAADEAFLVATKRAGSDTVLGKEFAKANPQSVWLDRVFWAVILIQAWSALSGLGQSIVVHAEKISPRRFLLNETELNGWFGFFVSVAGPAMVVTLSATLALWLLKSPQGWLRKDLEYLSSRPLRLAVSLLALNLVTHTLSMLSMNMVYGGRVFTFWNYFRLLPGDLFYAVAAFILAQKCLLKKA